MTGDLQTQAAFRQVGVPLCLISSLVPALPLTQTELEPVTFAKNGIAALAQSSAHKTGEGAGWVLHPSRDHFRQSSDQHPRDENDLRGVQAGPAGFAPARRVGPSCIAPGLNHA
jgi:hypothetical protein